MMGHPTHSLALTVALAICWVSACNQGRTFGKAASEAAYTQDFSGIGDAHFEFELNLLLTPIAGLAIYGAVRLLMWLAVIGSARLRAR